MAKDTLRSTTDSTGGGLDQIKPGTTTGTASKGYAEHETNGSEYNKFGNRIDYNKLAATNFK
jgi:hypothetical protein